VITYEWRGRFTNAEVNALHAEGFGHEPGNDDWQGQAERHSLGWVCARDGENLAGFVNVAWDGGVHAFILDTLVATAARRHGIGTRMVAIAASHPGRITPGAATASPRSCQAGWHGDSCGL
jgi:ribosomal protein S18 acetylase RimI-like enzyme